MARASRQPIYLDRVLDDPGLVRRLVERNSPYFPVQRYFNGAAEFAAISGQAPETMIIAPNFRGDWADPQRRVEGVEPLLFHDGLIESAARLFSSTVVRPRLLFANITWQLPFEQGAGHTDIPAFRGIDRSRYPVWFLSVMGHSGLFEDERIRIATAVAWFYEGSDGGFTYWPDGPEAPPHIHEGAINNTAIVGDNDLMYHRVRPVGPPSAGMLTNLSIDTELAHRGGDDWEVRRGEVVARPRFAELRVSVSWKAYVFRDASEERLFHDGSADLSFDAVLERLYADLEERGTPVPRQLDPLRDPEFVRLLATTYMHYPTVFAPPREDGGEQRSHA